MTPEVIAAASQLMGRHLVLFVAMGQPDLHAVAMRRASTACDLLFDQPCAEPAGLITVYSVAPPR